MAITTSFGYTDTNAAKPLSVNIPDLAYLTDFSMDSRNQKTGEVILTNTTTPIDQPEILRFAIENVANVYANSNIPSYNRSVTTRGVSLLLQVNDILRVSDPGSECCCGQTFDLPISTHIVLRVPLNQFVTANEVMAVAKRNFAMLFAGADNSARLNELLRGTLSPL